MLLKVVVVTFESSDEILNHDHASESYQAARFCGVSRFEALCFFVISSLDGGTETKTTPTLPYHLEGTVQPGYLVSYILIQSTKTSPFQPES